MFQYNIVAWSVMIGHKKQHFVCPFTEKWYDVFMDDAPLESSIGIILLAPSFLMLAVCVYM